MYNDVTAFSGAGPIAISTAISISLIFPRSKSFAMHPLFINTTRALCTSQGLPDRLPLSRTAESSDLLVSRDGLA